MTAEEIKNIASLLNISIPLVVAIIVFTICLANLDKLFLLLAKIQTFFSFCSARARKGAISNSIRGKILHSSKKMRSFGEGVLVSDLKIEWVKEENAETFLKKNQVIIRMSQNVNPHKNYVTAIKTYVGHGLLPKSKRYIDSSILAPRK